MVNNQDCLSKSKQTIIDLDKWQQTVDIMSELYGSVNGSIVQFRQNTFNVVVTSNNQENFLARDDFWPWEIKSFCRKIVETQEHLYVKSAQDHEHWKDAPPVAKGPVRSYCGLPLFWPDGSLFGTICVIDTSVSQYSSTLVKMLQQFSQIISSDLKMLCDYEAIKSLAITDDLTGLYNRRGLTVLGEQKIKDAKRSKDVLGITYLDIDNLKQINDQSGHAIGDQCLMTLAKVLEESCRDNDIKARIGGDEFIIMSVFNKDNDVSYNKVLNELCQRVMVNYQAAIKNFDTEGLTSVSYGGLTFKHHQADNLEEMIEQADQLMYQHKQGKGIA